MVFDERLLHGRAAPAVLCEWRDCVDPPTGRRDDIADAVEAIRSTVWRDYGDGSCATRNAQGGERRGAVAASGQAGAGSSATEVSDSVSSFSVVIARRRVREICICEIPICSAISRCVRSSKKRS